MPTHRVILLALAIFLCMVFIYTQNMEAEPDVDEALITGLEIQEADQDGWILKDGDCPGGDMKRVDGLSVLECRALCRMHDECKGFSYHSRARKTEPYSACIPKSRVCDTYVKSRWRYYRRPEQEEVDAPKGWKVLKGDCVGTNIKKLVDITPADCAAECRSDSSCRGFSFNPRAMEGGGRKAVCWTKSGACTSPRPSGWNYYYPTFLEPLPSEWDMVKGSCTDGSGSKHDDVTIRMCYELCKDQSECQGISYHHAIFIEGRGRLPTCWLRTSPCTRPTRQRGWITYNKPS